MTAPAELAPLDSAPAPPVALAPVCRIRLLPAPSSEPPYDDELDGAPAGATGTLPLPFDEWDLGVPLRALHAVPAAPPVWSPIDPDRSVPAEPISRERATVVVRVLAEFLAGARPRQQLAGLAMPGLVTALHRPRTWRPDDTGRVQLPAVRSVHVTQPSATVAEVCAVIRRGPRHHALAVRLRLHRGRWVATTVQVG
jgi:hypothetical protein